MMFQHILTDMTIENVISSIRDYEQKECKYIRKYYRYYNGVHDINNRTTTEGRPCSKVVSNEVRKIADLYVGFVGVNDVDSTDQFFQDIQPELQDCVKDCLITGVGYGLILYDKKLTYKRIAPTRAMVFRDSTLSHNVIGGAFWNRFTVMDNGHPQEYTEVYVVDNSTIYYYKGITLEGVTLQDSWRHNIPDIPLIEFKPDSHYDSCFSPAIPLQDMLNMSLSSYQDGRETFADPFLMITGIGISEESAQSLIDGDKKILNLPLADADAKYLVKEDSASDLTTMLDDITERIYRSCSIPLTEDVKYGTASGAALAAKYLALTRICSSIRRSLDLSIQYLADNTTGFSYEWPEPFEDITGDDGKVENPLTSVSDRFENKEEESNGETR